jgi:hypothetical protein
MPSPRQHTDNAARQKAYRDRRKQDIADQLTAKGIPAAAPIPTMPSMTRWQALHEQATAALQAIQDEMTAYHSDRSERWQEGERGQHFQDVIDQLDDAQQTLESIDLSVT